MRAFHIFFFFFLFLPWTGCATAIIPAKITYVGTYEGAFNDDVPTEGRGAVAKLDTKALWLYLPGLPEEPQNILSLRVCFRPDTGQSKASSPNIIRWHSEPCEGGGSLDVEEQKVTAVMGGEKPHQKKTLNFIFPDAPLFKGLRNKRLTLVRSVEDEEVSFLTGLIYPRWPATLWDTINW